MRFRQLVFRQFLEDGEQILRAFRRRFPLMKLIFWSGFFVSVATLTRWLFFEATDPTGEWVYVVLGTVGLYKVLSVFFYWYANAILMTSETLMFVNWGKMFEPRSERLDYWDLDTIDVLRTGAASYVRNTGDLSFNKISGGEPILFESVYRPHRTEKTLTANRERMNDEKNFTEQSALKEIISGLVDAHVRSHGQPDDARERARQKLQQAAEKKPAKKTKSAPAEPEHFENQITEVEKKLDDTGGVEIDL